MLQNAATTGTAGALRINPANGSEIITEAGQAITLAFDIANESPEIVSYAINAEQVPEEWVEDAPLLDAAPGTNDRVHVVLRPFVNAMEGVYPVRLSILADGSVMATTALSLRVTPAPPAPEPVSIPLPPDPVPVITVPDEPPPKPVVVVPEIAPPKPVVEKPKPVVRVPEPPPTRPDPAPPVFEPIHYQPLPDLPQEIDEPEERNVVVSGTTDGGDGEVFTVAPGQTLLVRLTVQNDGAFARNYVLEDDQLLDINWLDLRQYDINLDRNAVGELRFRLTPPAEAEPGAYPFGVRFGPSDAARRIRQFTLLVPALPAVQISAEKPALTMPFGTGKETEFALQVVSTGNADTAFRVGVTGADGVHAGANVDVPYLYETARWRYLFDREIEEVRVPENRQAARPETVRLRVARKGIWWLGWSEKHQVTVGASPVMRTPEETPEMPETPRASGETTLTLRRWRILPVPGFVVAPLVLLLLPLLGGGARDILVENGVPGTGGVAAAPTDDSGTSGDNLYYVLQSDAVAVDPSKPAKSMSADISWTAPAGAWLSLWSDKSKTLASGPFTRRYVDTPAVPEYGVTRTYTVGAPFSRKSVTVRYLPLRTASLAVVVKQGRRTVTPKVFAPPGGIETGGREYVLPRAGGPATISLTNGYRGGLDVLVWMATSTGGASVGGIATVDAKRLLPRTTLPTVTIAPPATGDAEVVLLTTDAKAQVIRVRFEGG